MKNINELLLEKGGSLEDINKYIPERYLETEIDEKMSEKIKEVFKKDKGIYFYGSVGTGKTYLLYGIFRRLRVFFNRTQFWNLPDTLSRFRFEYGKDGGGEENIDSEIKTGGILLIDDLGSEKTTEWNLEILYRLINYRYENKISTFFASNLSLQELAEKYGDRITSRIAEMTEVVKVEGEDKRLK